MSAKTKDDVVESLQEIVGAHREKERMKEESMRLIRDLMVVKGWTQAELAVKLNVAESTAWRWYEGKSRPIPSLRKRIEEMLERATTVRSA